MIPFVKPRNLLKMKAVYLLNLLFIAVLPVQAQVLTGDSIPVRLNSLEAGRVNNNNQLSWRVTCSLDYAFFDIQRSADGISYSTIHTFQADKNRCLDPFSYIDQHNSVKSFYRVRVGDLDGKFYTSKIVVAFGTTEGFDILFPGIVTGTTVPLTVAATSNDILNIRVTSSCGYPVIQKQAAVLKGTSSIPVSVQGLPGGIYIISVTNGYGAVSVTRFFKQ